MINRKEVEHDEETLRKRVRGLSDAGRRQFYQTFEQEVKDPDTYAVLNWLFLAGLHHFYLGLWLRGSVNLLVFCAGIALVFLSCYGSGAVLAIGITLFELPALFQSQIRVKDHNNRTGMTIVQEIQNNEPKED